MPIAAALPENEAERLAVLRGYDVLDTPPEDGFDRLTALASEICHAPIALVSLVDESRQWFKSRCGLDAPETSRDVAFCAHAILEDQVFIIPDATADERFKDSPLVLGPPHIRSYAGVPLKVKNNTKLGTLCVIHDEVTHLTEQQIRQLERLAAIAVDELDLRLALKNARLAQEQIEARSTELSFANDTLEEQARKSVEIAEDRERLYLINDQNRRFTQALIETVPVPIFSLDDEQRVTHANPAYAALVGRDLADVLEKNISELYNAELAQEVLEHNKQLIAAPDDHITYERKLPREDGSELHTVIHKAVIRDENQAVQGIAGAIVDVTEQKALQARLERLATTDPLTGACNRRAFLDRAESEFQRIRRYGGPLSLILIDLDRFKAVNDTYGHDAGDEMLRLTSRVCAQEIRESVDMLARLGGEEFAIIAPETDSAGAAVLAERLRATLAAQEAEIARKTITFTASFGVVTVDEQTNFADFAAVQRAADQCLYASKDSGRNCVTVFDREAGRLRRPMRRAG